MKIQKFEEHSLYDSMSLDFIEGFNNKRVKWSKL
jgi:hypothetical protein